MFYRAVKGWLRAIWEGSDIAAWKKAAFVFREWNLFDTALAITMIGG
jgi:hypothetical protein